jgi:AraC family transcriptional regulator of adaptative response/methylated-DNA-[protein]-cysteine methyltransferase
VVEYEDSSDYARVQRAIEFIADRFRDQPTLADVATHLGLSRYHVQRLFKRWAGVSPKRFLQYVTLEHAKRLLRDSDTVLSASYGAGLSGPGRLHDLFVTVEGVTPGQFRRGGAGVELRWGVHDTPFGAAFFAVTDRGLTSLGFLPPEGHGPLVDGLAGTWPSADVREDPDATAAVARQVFFPANDSGSRSGASPALRPDPGGGPTRLQLHVRGTNFQVRVWEALLRIPVGSAATYSDLAEAVGRPRAARAVGNAVGRNPVAVIIPCHRVLRRNGRFGGYRWGRARKRALLGWESARVDEGVPDLETARHDAHDRRDENGHRDGGGGG